MCWSEMKKALQYSMAVFVIIVEMLVMWNVKGGADANFPVVVTDDLGRTVTITSQPQRIVCIAPSTRKLPMPLVWAIK